MGTTKFEITEDEVKRALDGNEGLFSKLVHTYKQSLMAVLHKNGISLNDMEDCAQHAFMQLWINKNSIQLYNTVFNWLCTTALNRAKTVHRKTGRMQLVGDSMVFDNIMAPKEDTFPYTHHLKKLHKSIAEMNDPYRAILIMQLAGSSYKEMATKLGRPIGTIMSRRSRAMQILGEKMKKNIIALGDS